MIFFNTTKPPFDDQRVRQAVMYSIDAPQLIDIGLAGEGRIARSPLPPESDRYREPQMQYNYDPEKSKELLKEAGYDPDNEPLQFQLGVVEWAYVYPQAPLLAQTMQLGGFEPAAAGGLDRRPLGIRHHAARRRRPRPVRRLGGHHRFRGVHLRPGQPVPRLVGAAGQRTPASRRKTCRLR